MRRPGLGLMLSLCLGGMSMFAESFHYLDITYLNKYNIRNAPQAQEVWDTLHLVASLQGIVNRKGPRLFVRFMPDPDDFWFDYCTKESGWLTGSEVIRHEGRAGLLELIGVFKDDFKGIVSYPDKPFASSNVASTVAGVESRLVLRRDESEGSLYQDVMKLENRPKDELKLTAELMVPKGGSTGSPKNDAIRWAKERYLDTDMCSSEYMAYYIDMYWLTDPGQGGVFSNSTLTNHDFYIGHGAFFFDLGVWGDEIVFDDPGQPRGIDRETLLMLLKKQYQRAGGKTFVIGGFPPWAWKYADRHHRHNSPDGRRHPVQTEWEYCRIISSFNGMKDADALGLSGMVNASFYRFFPLKEKYPQPAPAPTEQDLVDAGYLDKAGEVADHIYMTWYMGDYDSAAWLNRHAQKWWSDPMHGKTMCAWAFDPSLAIRAPHAMHYVRTKAAPTDYFIAGDNGYGYLAPTQLSAPRLDPEIPDGWGAWSDICRKGYNQFDISITGFIIDPGADPKVRRVAEEYAKFSPEGFVYYDDQPQGEVRTQNGVPYVRMYKDIYGDPEKAANELADNFKGELGVKFIMVRSILKSPSWHEETGRRLKELTKGRVVIVDPRTFFLLGKHAAKEQH